MEGLFKAEDGQTVGSDHTTEWWKKCMSARYNRVSRFHFVPSSANCLVWRQRRLHLKINTIFKYACGQSFSPTTCVKSNSKSIKGRGSNVCANMEVSLVQHEILVSKMPSFGIGSKPQLLAQSSHGWVETDIKQWKDYWFQWLKKKI